MPRFTVGRLETFRHSKRGPDASGSAARIGIVGAGTIVRAAHIPAYLQEGLTVDAVFDLDQDLARTAAAAAGADVASTLDDLFARSTVSVVDIAVPPSSQVTIARQALDAGKHVLCQKPLAPTLSEAADLVEHAERRGLLLAVNQQMRWEPLVGAVRGALDDGTLGDPVAAVIDTNLNNEFPPGHWLRREPRVMGLFGAIHLFDALRFLFGNPETVAARMLSDPRSGFDADMWVNAWLEWPSGLFAVIHDRYTNLAGDIHARMRVEGSHGAVRGHFGLWDDYPNPSPDIVEVCNYGEAWRLASDTKPWLPDAFAGPMLSLIEAIDGDGAPATSGRDNLDTLRIVEAAYESSRRGTTVRISDIGVA